MGDVVKLGRKVSAVVNRFGHAFSVEYKAGRNTKRTNPEAAIAIDGKFFAWLTVTFDGPSWSDINVELAQEMVLVTPEMVGAPPSSEMVTDHRFVLEAEEYILSLLNESLAEQLRAFDEPLPEANVEPVQDPRATTPWERGLRAAQLWHDSGKNEDQLPALLAVEVFDALEAQGMAIADSLDEAIDEVSREQCGALVRTLIDDTLNTWREHMEAGRVDA
jgi:hypothetical protein